MLDGPAVPHVTSDRAVPVRALGRVVGAASLDRVFGGIYRWVARHRHALPGGSPTCELPTS